MRPAALVAATRPGSSGAGPMSTTLTDPQAAAVLVAIVQSEIEQAHVAEGKAASGGVADLAAAIMAQRSATELDLAGVISMLPRGLAHSAMRERVEADADRVSSSVAGQTGADFDIAYVAGQIRAFERDIAVLDTRLVPDAQAHELQRVAKELRADTVEDLATARRLHRLLVRGVAPSGAAPCAPRKRALPDRSCS
jgi:predicted outer membrane protein